jgi:ketosteroid isomerase-like protein
MDERAKNEVLATYAAYVAAFRASDVEAIDKLMQYPLAHIGNGQTTLLDTYPIKPAESMAAKQWHDSKDITYEVVFASADKAHLILRQATRVRVDGSPIETVSVFYALTRTASGWKFFAVSDIIIPA